MGDDEFDALLGASSLGAPHVRGAAGDVPASARHRMAQAVQPHHDTALTHNRRHPMATKKDERRDAVPGHTRHLLGYGQVYKMLHLSRTQVFRDRKNGIFLTPDAIITPDTQGWDKERVLAYGVDVGRLAEDGQPAGGWMEDGRPRNRVPDGAQADMQRIVRDKYSAEPTYYLGSAHCSFVYDLSELAVFFLRERGAFIPADVKIGDKFLGWKEENVIEFGQQTGRLEDPAVLRKWAVRRTEEFGLDPHVPWVVDLLGADNLPQFKLRKAAAGDTP